MTDGYGVQYCLAAREYNLNTTEGFGWYEVESGSRYEAGNDKFDFTVSLWSVEFEAPEAEIPEIEVQVQDTASGTADKYVNAAGADVTEKVQMDIDIGYEVVTGDIDKPNKLGFIFSLDLPSTLATRGSVIFQYITFRKQGDWESPMITVGCATTVGDPSRSAVLNFRDVAGSSDDTNTAPVDLWADKRINEEFELRKGDIFFFKKRDDVGAYEMAEWGKNPNNVNQLCVAQMPFAKVADAITQTLDEDAWGKYDVKFGARVYASDSATTFANVFEGK